MNENGFLSISDTAFSLSFNLCMFYYAVYGVTCCLFELMSHDFLNVLSTHTPKYFTSATFFARIFLQVSLNEVGVLLLCAVDEFRNNWFPRVHFLIIINVFRYIKLCISSTKNDGVN